MAVTDTRTVAGILFAETDELRALPGKDAELANLRAALAEQIIASDNGVGFKQPAIPTNADLADTNIRAVWDACVAAANAAIGRDPAQSGAVFIDDQDPTKDRARLSEYPWLARKNPKVFGEADWRGIPVKLYVVDVTGVAPGRYPPHLDPRQTKPKALTGTSPLTGAAVFTVLVLLQVGSGFWTRYDATPQAELVRPQTEAVRTTLTDSERESAAADKARTEAAQATANASRLKSEFESRPPAIRKAVDSGSAGTPQEKDALDLANRLAEAGTKASAAEQVSNEQAARRERAQRRHDEAKRHLAEKQKRNQVSLLPQAGLTLVGLIGIFTLVSWGLRREIFGFFVDDRERMSLARFQFVVWTVVILTGYFVASMWNLGVTDPSTSVLPKMQQDLWLLLGIVTASPLASALILDSKGRTDPASAQAGSPNPPGASPPQSGVTPYVPPDAQGQRGVLEVRTKEHSWSVLDLFSGEEIGNSATVDISRVQQFVFTLVLVIAYSSLILSMIIVGAPAGQRIEKMPELDLSLVGLLGLSHAAHLAAKALPKKA